MMNFMQAIFSLDNARYATIQTLADDIMTHSSKNYTLNVRYIIILLV